MWEVRTNGMERIYRYEIEENGITGLNQWARVGLFFICDLINASLEGSKVKQTSSCVSLCSSHWEIGVFCSHEGSTVML